MYCGSITEAPVRARWQDLLCRDSSYTKVGLVPSPFVSLFGSWSWKIFQTGFFCLLLRFARPFQTRFSLRDPLRVSLLRRGISLP